MSKEIVSFNLEGEVFTTKKSTLNKEPGTLFEEWVSNDFKDLQKNENGEYVIDRSPKYFGYILDYIRLGNHTFGFSELSQEEKEKLAKEAKHYKVKKLQKFVNSSEKPLNYKSTVIFVNVSNNYSLHS